MSETQQQVSRVLQQAMQSLAVYAGTDTIKWLLANPNSTQSVTYFFLLGVVLVATVYASVQVSRWREQLARSSSFGPLARLCDIVLDLVAVAVIIVTPLFSAVVYYYGSQFIMDGVHVVIMALVVLGSVYIICKFMFASKFKLAQVYVPAAQ
jgi:hypothetical protein